MDATLKCPFTMMICAPTQSGKSHWVARLLKYQDDILETPVESVIWYTPHGHVPEIENNNIDIKVCNSLPWESDEDEIEKLDNHTLIVFDDFAEELSNSKELTKFFTRNSHHTNTSIIHITQNLFLDGSHHRTRSINANYILLMKQPRNLKQIRLLARQISHDNKEFEAIMKAYTTATIDAYGYLLLSFHPRDSYLLMLRSHIFPEDARMTSVYVLRKYYKRSDWPHS